MNASMNSSATIPVVLSCAVALVIAVAGAQEAIETNSTGNSPGVIEPPGTAAEAHARARLLHEAVHGALQVMHRDLFDEENIRAIPSGSLEDVFKELKRTYRVEMKWLNVNTDVVNVDHQPEGEFEERAAKRLAAGDLFVESTTNDRYQFAGPIRLASQCLKCHLKHRRSTEDRVAGLVISMPILERPLLDAAASPESN